LGILAALAIPRLTSTRANAAKQAHNANVRTLQSAGNLAVADGTTDVTWGGTASTVGKTTTGTAKGWEDYMQEWPALPANSGATLAGSDTTYKVVITGTQVVVTPALVP
jgi:type II secretory pathway pseudopilin PulG